MEELHQIGLVAGGLIVGIISGFVGAYKKPENIDGNWTCRHHSGLVEAIDSLKDNFKEMQITLTQINNTQTKILAIIGRIEFGNSKKC